MARDLAAAFGQTGRTGPDDLVLAADAVACVASHAQHASDARLLLDALGLTDAAPIARAFLRMTKENR